MLANYLSEFLQKNLIEFKNKKFLLAVSGGMDSIVMLDLFHTLKLNIVVAHCNFHLRGVESDGDEAFVVNLGNRLGIPVFVRHFDIHLEKENQHEGTQVIARNLRYAWFESLRNELECDFICTAHHETDQVETIIQRLIQGGFPEGLQGIKTINGPLLRPLISVSHGDIFDYVKAHGLNFRIDSSNSTDYYTRNKVRHIVLPALKEVFGDHYLNNIANAGIHQHAYSEYIKQQASALLKPMQQWQEIELSTLRNTKGNVALLYECLKSYGFNWTNCTEICKDLYREQGVCFENNERTYKLHFGNDALQLVEVKAMPTATVVFVCKKDMILHFPDLNLEIKSYGTSNHSSYKKGSLYFDTKQIEGNTILIRCWKAGDRFTPLGMAGSKLVSDFLKDLGLTPAEKKKALIISMNNTIIGVAEHRIDEAYKCNIDTKNILEIRKTDV